MSDRDREKGEESKESVQSTRLDDDDADIYTNF